MSTKNSNDTSWDRTSESEILVGILNDKEVLGRTVEHTASYVYKTQALTLLSAFTLPFGTTLFLLVS